MAVRMQLSVQHLGRACVLGTLAFALGGFGLEALNVYATGVPHENPLLLALATLNFYMWSAYAWRKQPRDYYVYVANITGMGMSGLVLALSACAMCR